MSKPAIENGASSGSWEQIQESVNAWRGYALHCFAKAEAAVTETLVVLATDPSSGSSVRLRHLVGQRFEDLASAIGDGGPFAEKGSRAAKALADFRQHESLRPFLCHGVAKLALCRNGQWLAVFRVSALRSRQIERSSVAYEQREAEVKLKEIKDAADDLAAALQSLRHRLKP